MDQYAIENNKPGSATMATTQFTSFFKPQSRLYLQAKGNTTLSDILGNTYTYGSFDSGVKVSTASTANFTDVIDVASSFWGRVLPITFVRSALAVSRLIDALSDRSERAFCFSDPSVLKLRFARLTSILASACPPKSFLFPE